VHQNKLSHAFENRLSDIRENERLINLFENNFNRNPENIETALQLKVIEH
jgi:hypothetical protein